MSINAKKKKKKNPAGINSRRFILDGLKPFGIKSREMDFWTVWAKSSEIPDGLAQTVQILYFFFCRNLLIN